MKSVLCKTGYIVSYLLTAAYGVMLMTTAIVVRAQPVQYQVNEIERRVSSIENLNLDHRMTVLETLLQDSNTKTALTMGGTGLLIAERVVQALRRKGQL